MPSGSPAEICDVRENVARWLAKAVCHYQIGRVFSTDKQVADIQTASDAAQAAADAVGEYRPEEAGAVDASEDISMEEVLGPGTHKKPVANEDADVPRVESQTV